MAVVESSKRPWLVDGRVLIGVQAGGLRVEVDSRISFARVKGHEIVTVLPDQKMKRLALGEQYVFSQTVARSTSRYGSLTVIQSSLLSALKSPKATE